MRNLMWLLLGVAIVLFFTVMCELASAAEVHSDMTLYTTSTDQNVTVAWDDTNPDITDYFDFYMWNYGEEKKYLIGKTQQLQITFQLPRTGLYIFYARACDKPDTDDTRKCSEYAHSMLVDSESGVPYGKVEDPNNPGTYIQGKWMIYGHVGAPTGGGVN